MHAPHTRRGQVVLLAFLTQVAALLSVEWKVWNQGGAYRRNGELACCARRYTTRDRG